VDAYRNQSWPAPSAGYEDDQPIDLKFYLEALLRHKWLILFLTVALSLGATGYVLTAKRVYSATARVQVQQSSGRYITITGQPAYGAPPVDAAESLKTQVKFVYSSLTLGEAVRYLREQQGIVVPPDAFRGLKVMPEEPDVIAISVEHESPRMAAALANAIATAYRDQNTLQARRQARGAQEYIRQRLDEIRSDLARVEEQMKPLKIRQHIPWNETGDMTRAMQIAAYEDQARQAEMEVASLRNRVRVLRGQLAAHPRFRQMERPAEDPFLTGLRQEKVRLEVELAKLRADYKETDPRILTIQDKINSIQNQIDEQSKKTFKTVTTEEDPNYNLLASQLFMTENSLAEAEAKALALRNLASQKRAQSPQLTEDQMNLARLQRQADVLQRTYTVLLERLQEERINEAQQLGNVNIIDFAQIPTRPVRPVPEKTIPLAAAVGLLLGVGLAMLREFLGSSVVATTDDIEKTAKLLPLGFIPASRRLRSLSNYLPVVDQPGHPLSEAIHSIRTSLKFATVDAPARTITVSSASAGEGKTFVAADLAASMAVSGQKVVLVDADLRRPKIHNIFGLERSPGLAELLADGLDVEDVLQATQTNNLKVITAGCPVPSPGILFDTQRMTDVIAKLSSIADVVVFDVPPILPVSDALTLASKTDGLILVVEQSRVAKAALADVRRMCDLAKVRIIGAVLNKAETGGGYYYGYHYKYYTDYYKHYKSDGSDQKALPTASDATPPSERQQTGSQPNE